VQRPARILRRGKAGERQLVRSAGRTRAPVAARTRDRDATLRAGTGLRVGRSGRRAGEVDDGRNAELFTRVASRRRAELKELAVGRDFGGGGPAVEGPFDRARE